MKRLTALLLGLAWLALLVSGLGSRWGRMAARLPTAFAGAQARADIRAGDEPYGRFLARVRAALAAEGGAVLILLDDPTSREQFYFYRAASELFPLRVCAAPVDGTPRTGGAGIKVGGDAASCVAARGTRLAAYYRTTDPAKAALFRIAGEAGARLRLAPASLPEPAPPRPGPSRPWLWPAGLAAVLVLGWLANAAAGLAAGAPAAEAAALAFLTGGGLVGFTLFALSLAGAAWSLPLAAGAWCVLAVGVFPFARRRGLRPAPTEGGGRPSRANVAGMAVAAVAVLAALLESAVPASAWSNWDAWAVWDLKVRAMLNEGGIPFGFLADSRYQFAHHEYPPGLPALQSFLALWAGGAGEGLLRLVSPLYLATLAALSSGLAGELGLSRFRWPLAAAVVTLPAAVAQGSSGYADLPVACWMAAGLLLVLRARRGAVPWWTVGAVGGLGGLVKSEGAVWAAACLVALAVGSRGPGRWRRLAAPALAAFLFLAPWQATKAHLGLRLTDFDLRGLGSAPLARAAGIAKGVLFEALGPGAYYGQAGKRLPFTTGDWYVHLRDTWAALWFAFVLGLAVGGRRLHEPGVRETAAALGVQALFVGAGYLASAHELWWHLSTSLDRVLLQAAPAALLLAASLWSRAVLPNWLDHPCGRADNRGTL